MLVELAEWSAGVDVFGNVARRKLTFIGRQVLPAHEHNFAHAHIVVRGTIRCTLKQGDEILSVTDYSAPAIFEIPARLGHQLESISEEGAEGWCLFAVRDEDGGVSYEVTEAHKKDRFWHERSGRSPPYGGVSNLTVEEANKETTKFTSIIAAMFVGVLAALAVFVNFV